ncbi:calcium/sodium antiporter [Kangiella sediminilitoris]|uniref:Na+/Ca+ antiporter, CaCA family n=1 Tax=Kangiella sediminilitoris TaxID=1144748 RepID=A0A1B3BCG4_9GAMM|nr:calcium/sodium antiporter [Kangiella sediminilitoris]AOE50499.1 Na+/Ca+ antiporter, CaCA family [Kangiella sediminilitoris]
MIENITYIIIGITLLMWSADRFTDGAAAIARNLGVSRLIVGLTIVAIGSSAPEIFVSILDSFKTCAPDKPDCGPEVAIGNALGSNITNIALVLGITALVKPLLIHSTLLRREIPILFLCSLAVFFFFLDLRLSHIEGFILLGALVLYFIWLVRTGIQSRQKHDPMVDELIEELPEGMPTGKATFWVILGLVLLVGSSKLLIVGASGIATAFGVSETVIGLTIVALGTSLPELGASVASVLKNEHEIAIGNVIGSNIFNLLGVLGIPAAIAAPVIEDKILYVDYPLMLALIIATAIMAYGIRGTGKINRIEGGILVAVFLGYYIVRFFVL